MSALWLNKNATFEVDSTAEGDDICHTHRIWIHAFVYIPH
jgi:hypothetical protein